jgi:hypothetical protein
MYRVSSKGERYWCIVGTVRKLRVIVGRLLTLLTPPSQYYYCRARHQLMKELFPRKKTKREESQTAQLAAKHKKN